METFTKEELTIIAVALAEYELMLKDAKLAEKVRQLKWRIRGQRTVSNGGQNNV